MIDVRTFRRSIAIGYLLLSVAIGAPCVAAASSGSESTAASAPNADPLTDAVQTSAHPSTGPSAAGPFEPAEESSRPGSPTIEKPLTSKADDRSAAPAGAVPSDAGSATDPLAPLSDQRTPPSAAEATWNQRVIELGQQIDQGMVGRDRADTLYDSLAADLWAYQKEVSAALRAREPDALERRKKLAEMYRARVRLLEWVTPERRSSLLGGGSIGMREVRREFENARLDFFFQTLAIPRGLRQIVDSVRDSPLDDIWRLTQLLFGVIIFRIWRRWARTGLPRVRQSALSIRPRTEVHIQVARLLWYFDRFRPPLEWLALLFFASTIWEPGDLEEVSTLIWVIVLWTLLTRFGLLLVDALAAGSIDISRGRDPGLRLRSLRLIAAWILLTGLGLDLTSRYVEEAAIHSWATRTFELLLLPLLFLLLHWWRSDIFRRLKGDSTFSPTARRIGKTQKGIAGYLNAAAGAVYIVCAELLKLTAQWASRFESGRKFVATLLRREVEGDNEKNVHEKPLSQQVVLELLTSDDTVIEGPYRSGIDRLKEIIATGRGATVAVLAERGGGLNTFLQLLKQDVGESMRVVDCPPGGPEKFSEAMIDAFELPEDADLASDLRPRLEAIGVRVIGVGNFHRTARPRIGGLEGILHASAIAESAGENIVWIVAMTRASWPYIKGMLGDRAILREIFEMSRWSEEQLEELYEARCRKAGIEPDFRQLVFPRQFDDGEHSTLEERNRSAYRRVLWELADGNPEVAIRLFAGSLRERPNGQIVVRLPQPASLDRVAASNRTTMLVLKVLVQTELATIDDLEQSIQTPRASITNTIAHCLQEGWVEAVYDHYQIKWSAYRTVKRVLIRQGLISR